VLLCSVERLAASCFSTISSYAALSPLRGRAQARRQRPTTGRGGDQARPGNWAMRRLGPCSAGAAVVMHGAPGLMAESAASPTEPCGLPGLVTWGHVTGGCQTMPAGPCFRGGLLGSQAQARGVAHCRQSTASADTVHSRRADRHGAGECRGCCRYNEGHRIARCGVEARQCGTHCGPPQNHVDNRA